MGFAITNFDGNGGLTQPVGSSHGSIRGDSQTDTGSGAYSLNDDCTGTVTLNLTGQTPAVSFRAWMVVVDGGKDYLPPADLAWSLAGVPEQLETDNEEAYWEIEKFIRLALKANPNVLECFYSPLIERCTPIAQELIDLRHIFLSQYVHRTYNSYVLSQFKKLEQDLRNSGQMRWKHVMHLIRLLLSGVLVLK